MAVFSVVPFIWAFTTSFYRYEIGGESTFVGISNYTEYFADPTFLPSFGNMLFLTLFHVVAVIIFPLLVAKLIFSLSSERARYIYRIIFLVPVVVPGVAIYMIWHGLIYNEMGGLLNEVLRFVGLASWTRGWLTDADTVLLAVAFVGFPFASGINVLIYYAGFASIPESVHEAARLDGAQGLKKLLFVDVPLILSQIKLLVILTVIAGVQGFEMVFILTKDGPGFKSMVPGFWMYLNAFSGDVLVNVTAPGLGH